MLPNITNPDGHQAADTGSEKSHFKKIILPKMESPSLASQRLYQLNDTPTMKKTIFTKMSAINSGNNFDRRSMSNEPKKNFKLNIKSQGYNVHILRDQHVLHKDQLESY